MEGQATTHDNVVHWSLGPEGGPIRAFWPEPLPWGSVAVREEDDDKLAVFGLLPNGEPMVLPRDHCVFKRSCEW